MAKLELVTYLMPDDRITHAVGLIFDSSMV